MIGIVAVLLLGVALSLDTFAVSLIIGVCCCSTPFQRRRFLILMGLFHIAFTLLGWICGSGVHRLVSDYDHWICFGVLAFLGVKMIYESFSSEEADSRAVSLALRNTLLLCVANSIDALATGFSLSMQTVSIGIVWAAVIIGFAAFSISAAGIKLGYLFSGKLGSKAPVLGGLILIAIGSKIVLEHLM